MSNDKNSLLLVDDNEMNRDLLARRLERAGFQVTIAEDGNKALEVVRREPPDLVLLDVDMPGLDGFQVLEILRETYSAAQLPVIMVTAMTGSEEVVRALRMGACDYVTKPVDFPVALARINIQLERKQAVTALRESEERYALAARGSNDGLWDLDLRKKEIYFSPRWKTMLGWEESEIGKDPDEWFGRVHPDDLDHLKADIQAHLDGQTPHLESEYRIRHRDESFRWMLGRGLAVRDASGKAYRMAGSQTDITLGKVADALTGLPNRILFLDQLSRCLERARRHRDYCFAVIFLDLDGFKLVNDSLGHVVGDQLLISIARRLEQNLRSVDLVARLGVGHKVARLGGDEFTVLVDNIRNSHDAAAVAERIKTELMRPFVVRGHEIFTSSSMGIALSNPGYEQAEELVRDADTAMYRAKMRGKACYEIFDAEMRASIVARLQLETDLRGALERNEFRVHYQPVVHLRTAQIVGFEALVRWQHPTRGLLPPGEFVSAAEETGLIIGIEEFVLSESTQQLKRWQERFPVHPPLHMSINLSSKHFIQSDLQAKCERYLREAQLEPDCMVLEITESTLVPHPDLATHIMSGLKVLKMRISIDDFGTGYSSLSYLQRFPFDNLKIDRSFVSRMQSCADSLEIVRTIMALAHSLDLCVVAEGVENIDQVISLLDLGCEMAQGYLFSKPLPAEQVERLLPSPAAWEELLQELQRKTTAPPGTDSLP
jgi:diguanylate cyclase (GGDEF)-like protein/PAS domain S-box-containing protein